MGKKVLKKKGGSEKTNLIFEELEHRLLLSADALAVVAESSIATTQELVLEDNDANTVIVQNFAEQSSVVVQAKDHGSELVIIDSRAPNFQQLHNDIINAQQQGRDIQVVVLDAHRDGVEQISEALTRYNNLDAVHIVSHGNTGKLQLGATQLDKQQLKERTEEIKQWSESFTQAGDLLLYGCNLAGTANGQSLVDALAKHTGTDVAASDDLTGNNILGGDWDLEYQTGDIETSIAFTEDVQENWQGVLNTNTASTDAEQTQVENLPAEESAAEEQVDPDVLLSSEAESNLASTVTATEIQIQTQVDRRQEIIFVDETVSDYQAFIDDIQLSNETTDYQVVVLDSESNGIDQISQILADFQNLDAVHVISHGTDGQVFLGNTPLISSTLSDNSEQISNWGNAFTAEGDLLFYGCNLAETETGQALIQSLSNLTGTDVAASDDSTGHASLGGDWDLEYQTGLIETDVAVSMDLQQSWVHEMATETVLDQFTIDDDFNQNAGSNNWVGAWTEVTASNPDAIIAWGELESSRSGGSSTTDYYRVADLTGATSATFTFDVTATGGSFTASDSIVAYASGDGGSTWGAALVTIPGNTAVGSYSYDISSYIAANTAIRLQFNHSTGPSGSDWATVDNVQISYVPGTAPVNTVPGAQSVNEDTVLILSGGGNTISVDDVDGNLASTQLSVTQGTVSVTLSGAATISAGTNGSSSLTIAGSQTDINATLASLSYQAIADYNGADTLTILSSDSAGTPLTDTDTIAITVNAVADIVDDTLVTNEDAAITANVLTGSSGASADNFEGTPLLTGVTDGTHGNVSLDNANGTLTYTPTGGWNGADTFTYTITSGGVTETATVTVNVTAIDDPPVNTVPGAQSVNEDTALSIGGISVDDVDGNLASTQLSVTQGTVTVTLSGAATISAGTNGSSSLTIAGSQADINATLASLSYQAIADYNGGDTLTVLSTDFSGTPLTDTDTVAITVNAVDDVATASNLSAAESYTEDTPLNLTDIVISDVDNTTASITLTLSDITAGSLNTGTSNAVTSTYTAGTGVWSASGAIADINVLLAALTFTPSTDYSGAFTIATNVNGGEVTGIKTMTGSAVNDAPVAVANAFTVDEASTTTIDLAANDSDADDGLDLASISIVGAPSNGSIVVNVDGTVDYTHNGSETVSDSFTYTIDDVSGVTSNTVTVSMTITPVNDVAIIGGVDTGSLTEDLDPDLDTLLEASGALTIVDPDAGEAIFTAGTIAGTYGDLTIDTAGNWNYVADNTQAVIQNLAAADTLNEIITVTSFDGTSHNIVLTIGGVNDAPVAQDDTGISVNEGGTVIIDLAVNDADIDSAIDLTSVSIIAVPANGSLIINGDGTVSYTHYGTETLSDTFSYTISDITGAISNTATVDISVNVLNDNPVAGDDVSNVNEGGVVIIDLVANDIDVDNALDLTSISIIAAPANGGLVINGDGTVTYTHNGSETISDIFTYTISDISGAISNTATVNINVTPQNDTPTTIGITNVSVNEDAANTAIDLNSAFNDTDNPDTELTYTVVGNTNIGLFASTNINASTGELILDYAADINGSSQISIRATDLAGASVDTLFTVTVTPVDDIPVLDTNIGAAVTSTSAMSIDTSMLSVTDIDNTATEIQYTATTLPSNGTLLLNGVALVLNDTFTEDDLINNRISYQVVASPTTNDQFVFTVTDGNSTLTNNAFNITILLSIPAEPEEPVEIVEVIEPVEVDVPDIQDDVVETILPVAGDADVVDGFESGFVPVSSSGSSASQQQQESSVKTDEYFEDNIDDIFESNQMAIENEQVSNYDLHSTDSLPVIQVQSIKALWVAVDKMKQQIDESTAEEVSNIEFRAATVSSSGVALTAGVVAWVLRSGALMTSLMSTIPLWKGYDPLPILAYRDDEGEDDEVTEDKIPTSLEELVKIKKIKESMKSSIRVDSLFGNT